MLRYILLKGLIYKPFGFACIKGSIISSYNVRSIDIPRALFGVHWPVFELRNHFQNVTRSFPLTLAMLTTIFSVELTVNSVVFGVPSIW